jgi:phosphatidylglycerophosphatase C
MGIGRQESQGDAAGGPDLHRPIVAFDFDGTLTIRDTFLAFLQWRRGPVAYAAGGVRLIPDLLVFLARRKPEPLKAAAVRVFLRGLPLKTLEEEAKAFAEAAAPALLRPDALEAWRREKRSGARVIIVTASPEAVVAPFARLLAADALIGTRLAVDAQGRLTGALNGANCRGAEKVRRIQALFGANVGLKTAYGDTAGDVEMLALAENGLMGRFVERPRPGARELQA